LRPAKTGTFSSVIAFSSEVGTGSRRENASKPNRLYIAFGRLRTYIRF
jgi:hypothetical protein